MSIAVASGVNVETAACAGLHLDLSDRGLTELTPTICSTNVTGAFHAPTHATDAAQMLTASSQSA